MNVPELRAFGLATILLLADARAGTPAAVAGGPAGPARSEATMAGAAAEAVRSGPSVAGTSAEPARSRPPCPALSAQAAVVELLEISGVFAKARSETEAVVARLRLDNPQVPDELWSHFSEHVANHDTLVSLYAPIYLHHLSRADVCALVEFYRTPAGVRLLRVDPQIEQETRAAAQAWATSVTLALLDPSRVRQDESSQLDSVSPPMAQDIAAIHDLLRRSGALAGARRAIDRKLDQLRHAPQSAMLPGSFWEDARQRLSSEDELLRLWTPAYARQLTSAEVAELLRFFSSPAGVRYVAALPAIESESLDAGTQLGHDAAKRAVREVFGPLPQWRLLHPSPAPAAVSPGQSDATSPGPPKAGAPGD